jgi:hypothetical protein
LSEDTVSSATFMMRADEADTDAAAAAAAGAAGGVAGCDPSSAIAVLRLELIFMI